MMSPTTYVSALWLVWLAGWLLAAGWTGKTVARQSPASQLAHTVVIWLGAAVLFFHLPVGKIFEWQFPPISAWIGWGGVFLVAGGLAFACWARFFLGRLWSGSVTLKAEHVIIRAGPYALTRHPIYTGLLLALVGTVLVRGTLGSLLGFFLLALGVMLKIRQEERLLIGHFGDAYRVYQGEVPTVIPLSRRKAA